MPRANGLEAAGRTREACAILIRALDKEPHRIEWMRVLAYWLYRDGRMPELLRRLVAGPEVYDRDAYLVLQKASCLANMQRLSEAMREYRRVLELTQDSALRAQAEDNLKWLDDEQTSDAAVRAGLGRARWGMALGAAALVTGAAFLWLAHRRESLETPAVKGAAEPLQDVQDA